MNTQEIINILNKVNDSTCERFDSAMKGVKEVFASIQKRILELKEALLEEYEKEYTSLCDEALEIEEKIEGQGNAEDNKLVEYIKRLQSIPNELCFINFDNDFYECFFNKLIILI